MFNDIIKLSYEEDFTEHQEFSCIGINDGFFTKVEYPVTFNTKGIFGYSILKNQLVMVDSHYEVKYQGVFKDTIVKERCKKFSHLEDLYIYYRIPEADGVTAVSRFVTNKLILRPEEKINSESGTRQQVVSHEDGGWCIVTYNSVTDKIISCSERFDYK